MTEFLNAPGFVPSLVMKVTLVLLAGSIIALLLQKANASSRHAIWPRFRSASRTVGPSGSATSGSSSTGTRR